MDKAKTEKSGIRPGVIVAVVMIVGVVVAGRMLGWFGSGKKKTDGPDLVESAPATTEPATPAAGGQRLPGTTTAPRTRPGAIPASGVATAVPGATPGVATPDPGTPTDPAMADWSAKLDDVLGSEDDENKKADRLLAMWKNLPEDGQAEVMQHISNLLTDEKFPALIPAFTNAATSEAVLDIIMTDALNRPNAMKLPALLDVAKTPGHPKAEEAREILEVFVDENFGADWAKWDAAVQKWLKENPDEPEPPK